MFCILKSAGVFFHTERVASNLCIIPQNISEALDMIQNNWPAIKKPDSKVPCEHQVDQKQIFQSKKNRFFNSQKINIVYMKESYQGVQHRGAYNSNSK
jgi:hypothetical protein